MSGKGGKRKSGNKQQQQQQQQKQQQQGGSAEDVEMKDVDSAGGNSAVASNAEVQHGASGMAQQQQENIEKSVCCFSSFPFYCFVELQLCILFDINEMMNNN